MLSITLTVFPISEEQSVMLYLAWANPGVQKLQGNSNVLSKEVWACPAGRLGGVLAEAMAELPSGSVTQGGKREKNKKKWIILEPVEPYMEIKTLKSCLSFSTDVGKTETNEKENKHGHAITG